MGDPVNGCTKDKKGRSCLSRNKNIKYVAQPNFLYLTQPFASTLTFFVALKCVSVCIAAETALSNTNFKNLMYIII
jgi:hypothetical protein